MSVDKDGSTTGSGSGESSEAEQFFSAQAAEAQFEVAMMKQSLSWRITSPLRKMRALVGWLNGGSRERTENEEQPKGVQFRIPRSAELKPDSNVLFYVAFCPRGILSQLHLRSIEIYRKCGYEVVVIVNSGEFAHFTDIGDCQAPICIIRENVGYDFGAWAHACRLIGGLEAMKSVTFTNDSILGPFDSERFTLLNDSLADRADVVFLTENHQIQPHCQSFFFALSASALKLGALSVIERTPYRDDVQDVIEKDEITLADRFKEAGFSTSVLFPTPELSSKKEALNPTIATWRELINRGFPYFKIKLVSLGIVSSGDSRVIDVMGKEWLTLLSSHLAERTRNPDSPTDSPNVPSVRSIDTVGRFGSNGALQAYNPPDSQSLPLRIPLDQLPPANEFSPPTILAVIHCFYVDEAEKILAELRDLQIPMRLVLTTDLDEKAERLQALLQEFGFDGEVVQTPNRGRDVAPFLVECRRHLKDEEIVLHLHTKKSPHDSVYKGWGEYLRGNLIDSPEAVRSILQLLNHSEIGLVYSEHYGAVKGLRNWGYDFEHTKALMKRMGVELSADNMLDFPTGTMFWAKAKALRPLLDVDLNYEDFEAEAGQVDGTLAHAVERSLLYVVEHAGFRHVKVANRRYKESNNAMSLSIRDIPALLRRHWPRLLSSVGGPTSLGAAVGEVYPVNVAISRDTETRMNVLVPTMQPEKIFGGVASAVRTAKQLIASLGVKHVRVIVTSDKFTASSNKELANRLERTFLTSEPNDDVDGNVVVDLYSRRNIPLVVRPNDLFFATAWWTADLALRLKDAQQEAFGRSPALTYLIQDYEPGFYAWSNHYALAEATYARESETIGIVNSEELANFFSARHSLSKLFYLPFEMNKAINSQLTPTVKKKRIIAYARPSVARNLFALLIEGLRVWQGRDPSRNSEFEILLVGETFAKSAVADIQNATIAGKLSLESYAKALNESAIGLSLMLSPHPSYPPLEMARAGCITITNKYENKDVTLRAPNFIGLNMVTPNEIANALDQAAARIELESPTPLVNLKGISTSVECVDFDVIANLLRQSVSAE